MGKVDLGPGAAFCFEWRMRLFLRFLSLFLVLLGALFAEEAQLKQVVIVTRHGVRAPTRAAADMAMYAAEPWPEWPVKPGILTPRGKELMKLMGAYYRDRYIEAGLLSAELAQRRQQVFFHSNKIQRTIETARGLAEGLIEEKEVDTHCTPGTAPDPLFNAPESALTPEVKALSVAAVEGRIGGNVTALVRANRAQFLCLDGILFPGRGAGLPAGKSSLLNMPASVGPGPGDLLVELKGPFSHAARFAENFVLEYCEGMPKPGWGRVNRENLIELLKLHYQYFDYTQRTLPIAQANASTLMRAIVRTLEQAADGKTRSEALAEPSRRLVFVVGHDTTLSHLSGMLGLSWLMDGHPVSPTVPGGALAFELWQYPESGKTVLRCYYIAASLDQMRAGTVLSPGQPPQVIPVFIPGCGSAGKGYEAGFDAFRALAERQILPCFATEAK